MVIHQVNDRQRPAARKSATPLVAVRLALAGLGALLSLAAVGQTPTAPYGYPPSY